MRNHTMMSYFTKLNGIGALLSLVLMTGCVPLNDQTVQTSPSATENSSPSVSRVNAQSAKQEESVDDAPSVSPAVKQLLATATQQMNQQQYDKAVSTCERAIRIDPRNASAYRQLAEIKFHQGKITEAEQFARKGLSVSKQSNFWLLNNERSKLESLLDEIQQAKIRG